jgi:hypothetical protein
MCWSSNRVIKIPIAAFSIEARSVIYLLQPGQRIPYSGDVVEFEAAFSFRSSSAKLQDLQGAGVGFCQGNGGAHRLELAKRSLIVAV